MPSGDHFSLLRLKQWCSLLCLYEHFEHMQHTLFVFFVVFNFVTVKLDKLTQALSSLRYIYNELITKLFILHFVVYCLNDI